MEFRKIIEVSPREIAEELMDSNSVDEITNFIVDCIPDDEVAEAVLCKLKRLYPDVWMGVCSGL